MSKCYDRDNHHPGNPGFGGSANSVKSPSAGAPLHVTKGEPNGMHGGVASAEASQGTSHRGSGSHSFQRPAATNAFRFEGGGVVKAGELRNSGVKGAHRVGKK